MPRARPHGTGPTGLVPRARSRCHGPGATGPVPQARHHRARPGATGPANKLVLTFWIIEHIRTQDDVQPRKQNQVWRQVPPGEPQHLHVLDPVGPAAPSAVLQTGRRLCPVRQDDLRPTPGRHHTWKTHTCAQLAHARGQTGPHAGRSSAAHLQHRPAPQLLSAGPQVLGQHHRTGPHVHAEPRLQNLLDTNRRVGGRNEESRAGENGASLISVRTNCGETPHF